MFDDSLPPNQLPYLTPRHLAIGGRIKEAPEDFVVEEIPAYSPCGEGEHLFLWIEKCDVSAERLTAQLARELRIPRQAIGQAGLKDRRAVTRQFVSVPASLEEAARALQIPGVRVLSTTRHKNKLRTGHLRGNRFEIVIRDSSSGAVPIARDLADIIADQGIPNYFGEQRFGIEGETLSLGLRLLRGEATPRDIPASRRKFLLRLALSAAQSHLFNTLLARRITEGTVHRVQPGDVMQVVESGGLFVAENIEEEQARSDRRETAITGPLFGPRMIDPTGVVREWEDEVLNAAGLTRDQFGRFPRLTAGTRRPFLLWPENMQVTEVPAGLRLGFTLPAGAYATSVLREFQKTDS